jgi:hypothetical protein
MDRQHGSHFAVACLLAALLWPILIIGYPLLFWDSVEYIAVGSGLAFGTMRPPNYAFIIRLLHWDTTLWPIVLGQAALAAWLIWRTMDAMQLSARGRLGAAAVIAATSLPFFIIWIMADVLGGLLVLGAFVAVARPPRSTFERVLLAVFLLGAGSAHVTYLPLLFGIGVVLFAATFLWRDLGLSRTAALGVIAAPILMAGILVATNFMLYGVVRVTYSSPVLALCRQVEDGLTQRTLDEECPVRGWRLCGERAALEGASSLWFGFSAESPLQSRLGGMVGYAAEAEEIVAATTRRYWRESLTLGLRRAGALLVSDDGASFGRTAAHQVMVLQHLSDAGYAHLDESARYSHLIPHPELIAAARLGNLTTLAWAPLLVLGGVIALRRRAPLAGLFLGLCLAAIVGNALIIGVGGDVEGRYHGRVAWLAVFGCYLAAVSGVVRSTHALPDFAWRAQAGRVDADSAVEYPRNA